MTADVDLLPLPSVLLNWPHPTNHAAILDYARANVAHATAAKDAEIEALRAEVERLREVSQKVAQMAGANNLAAVEAEARAERLAEALRFARTRFAPYMDDADRAAFDAALTPTEAADREEH